MKMKGVVITRDNLALLVNRVNALTRQEVLVGVPESQGSRKDTGPINNATLAYIHENGSPEAGIPARPFLSDGIAENAARLSKAMGKVAVNAMGGKRTDVNAGLAQVALMAETGVKRKLNDGPFTPLAPGTIAARLRRGRTGTKPLIDTGQLRNSIRGVVRTKG